MAPQCRTQYRDVSATLSPIKRGIELQRLCFLAPVLVVPHRAVLRSTSVLLHRRTIPGRTSSNRSSRQYHPKSHERTPRSSMCQLRTHSFTKFDFYVHCPHHHHAKRTGTAIPPALFLQDRAPKPSSHRALDDPTTPRPCPHPLLAYGRGPTALESHVGSPSALSLDLVPRRPPPRPRSPQCVRRRTASHSAM